MGLNPVIETRLESGIYVPDSLRANPTDPILGLDQWVQYFNFGGLAYPFWPRQTLLGQRQEWPDYTFEGYIQGIYKANGPIFTCMLVRMLVFSEARFQFRQFNAGRPGDLFGDDSLSILEKPWPNGTTGELLKRAIQDADLAGNAFFTRQGGYLRRLRPDWMTIVAGSQTESIEGIEAQNVDPFLSGIDTEVIGYLYQPGGPASSHDPIALLPEEVCHWAPIPDPIYRFRGMSWLTPVIREILGDNAATSHKLKFFENGATVNMVVSLDPSISKEAFDKWVTSFESKHKGTLNAYRTLYLGGGAQVTPVGATPQQIDFQVTQGAGETRIANVAGVPPVVAGFAEGLRSATYSNYREAKEHFGDATMRPLWRDFAGAMQTLVPPPHSNSQLWYDDRDIPFLRRDQLQLAQQQEAQARTLSSLIMAGFEPDSAVKAVTSGDFKQLVHSGLPSVQVQPPPAQIPGQPLPPGVQPELPAAQPTPANGSPAVPVPA